ncbi:ChbG/HpnK family deacetylase [Breznakia pachnodae]|uniref:Glycoside hydrolase/deacetylase ChbG (UPF0249 family) n=1 Tax=Breznakia pachnodae TaxID=265178 RepID=A0ABU0E0S3_9FIRM|nr:ChbG/HpnK family deacetylase [Breznakia pachnodae]MDQ0360379.1 putative glycoside hydrolase/deacetylase ChbG (UPF0249 family) [Breznakia pachnodae]
MKKILFRADDLGYSEAVNYGIEKSIKNGLIRNIGIMVNMEASDHGIALITSTDVCVGLHVNISNGYPLSELQSIKSITTEKGIFKSTKEYTQSTEDIVILEEALLEVEAQYHKFIELVGRKPAYMDGHAVSSNNFFKAIMMIADKYKIKYSPLPISMEEPVEIGNTMVYLYGGSTKEKSPKECLYEVVSNMDDNSCSLIVYHPGYLDAYILESSSLTLSRPFETQMLISDEIKTYINEEHISCITYDEL